MSRNDKKLHQKCEVAGKYEKWHENMVSGRKINSYSEIREEAIKYEKYPKNTYGQLNMGKGREI